MLYAIIGTDVPASRQRRSQTRPRHLAYIRPLVDAGRVIIAGPLPAIDTQEIQSVDITGSLIVAEFESIDDARAWADNDPYLIEGVFADVTVKPFVQVLP